MHVPVFLGTAKMHIVQLRAIFENNHNYPVSTIDRQFNEPCKTANVHVPCKRQGA